ncbi:High Potential Iron sulfur Protein Hip [Acidithiobacillus ferrivorans]|jgi:anaerobic selenocysteine-containing dehydrogenase|uniref:High Potential Iron sulfur Protein Hip n=3 Tax=Acidithiobacillus ferrivorans TaxID=160808 RepID=A0A1E7XW31_9PROT|nr:iron oxidase [Acidithiobacillus ferrivorans]MBN6741554.1 twin-arginine translocation signal domain-containing protein [Acidithiobacillus sp. MC6.1]AEM49324.1 iron oxidase [Acidithiobacillus ferrivorans SS3]MBU2766983.1 twin-arginine translocation signal domain-containing protein [Acidithiobacillus ferrivorans]MBU2849525.1 twin-arginine translocation signal domain-containing protein [Acidithiobacillus ferrivorans]OFA17258.1 iron oxidase [Acidithiobacillus ferrivorans]
MSKEQNGTEKPQNLSRRDVLKGIAITAGVVAAGAVVGVNPIGAAHAAGKCPGITPKASLQYQPHPKGKEQCSACANFIAPHCCKVVAGSVVPEGYCMAFILKPA